MKNLLYLVHRLPYPPNKGDKISSYHLLRSFSSRYRVFLGTFVDHPADWQYLNAVRAYCAEACIEKLEPRIAKLLSLRGLVTGEALTLPYYQNARLQTWVDRIVCEHEPAGILLYSGAMAQYVDGRVPEGARVVYDMDDVDSDKWRSYAMSKPWPLSWLYRRESRRLLAFERRMAASFDASVFISEPEAALFKTLAPEVADRVTFRTQGVDTEFFDPNAKLLNPFQPNTRALVFTGAMDYWPNIDAVTWFANDVFPTIQREAPNVLFYIVGMNPSESVRRLGDRPGICVTGAVPDVRPYVRHAAAAVLPLRIARGIQNKALEAMAMERPIIATSHAMTGIKTCPEFTPIVADDPTTLARKAIELLRCQRESVPGGRQCILRHYHWDTNLQLIDDLLTHGLESTGQVDTQNDKP